MFGYSQKKITVASKVRPIFIPEIDNRIIEGKIIGSSNRKMSGSIMPVFVRRRELSGSIAGETSVSGGEGNDDRRGA